MRTVVELMSNSEKIKEEETPTLWKRKNGIEVKTIVNAKGNRKIPRIRDFGFG